MTPEPLPPLCEAVINFEGQAPIPCNLPADHPGHCEFGSDESMRYQTAALDGLASNGPAQAYTMGYEAGRAEALNETTSLELVADGYAAAQEARADALAAASRLFAAYRLWVDHADSANPYLPQPAAAPTTMAEHVEDAIGLVGSARAVVAGRRREDGPAPDPPHRRQAEPMSDTEPVDWDAERRTYAADMPPHLRYTTTDRGFRHLPHIAGTHGGQPAGHVSVWESSAASGPHLWIEASHPSDRNDPNSTPVTGYVHIRAEDAWRFAEQIRYLVEHHYQGSAVPEPPQT